MVLSCQNAVHFGTWRKRHFTILSEVDGASGVHSRSTIEINHISTRDLDVSYTDLSQTIKIDTLIRNK
jgi:hypothetical protein